MTGLRTGEIASAEVIRKGVYEEIKRAYGSRGYIQADVGLEPTFKDGLPWAQEGVVDLTIEVEEGEAFFIRSIKFPGLIHTSEQLLRDQLLIWEGGIYSTELLLESIKRMNQLGVVEEIREKDLITRIDSRALQVDLDIQVKEKRKPF
jgi:outer membrane protein insertion porin family